jgi:hypothetical protein
VSVALLQALGAGLLLGFGAVGLRVASLLRRQGINASAWALTGVGFTLAGAVALAQAAAALGGAEAVVRWDAGGHAARAVLLAGYACALCLLASRRGLVAWTAARTWGLLAVCAAAGALAGAGTGGLHERLLHPMQALVSAVTVLALLAALWTALLNDAFDYLLWASLALYAVCEAVGVNLIAVLRWTGAPAGWIPSPAAVAWAAACSYAAMLLLALARERAARRGEAAPGVYAALARTRGIPAAR